MEVEAFLDSDMSILDSIELKEEAVQEDPILTKAETFMRENAELKPLAHEHELEAPVPEKYRLLDSILMDSHRDLFNNIHKEYGVSHRILTNIPLHEFIKDREGDDLHGQRISFLICDRAFRTIVGGVEFEEPYNAGTGLDFLREIFSDIGKPLVIVPKTEQLSSQQIHAKLSVIKSGTRSTNTCPKCGKPMRKGKAQKGKNAARPVWVCDRFPVCRGWVKA